MRMNFLEVAKRVFTVSTLVLISFYCSISFASFTPSNIFVFGDSLSDIGSNVKLSENNHGKRAYYTQPGGQNWVKYLANRVNSYITMKPYNPLTTKKNANENKGANDFAQGGAVTYGTGIPQPDGFKPMSLMTQYRVEYTGLYGYGKVPNALYIIFGGANDIFKALKAKKSEGQLMYITKKAADEVVSIAKSLSKIEHATHILVMGLPDMGATPFAAQIKETQLLTKLTKLFNQEIQSQITDTAGSAHFVFFNTQQFMTNVIRDKGAYIDGANYVFLDVTKPACKTSALTCLKPVNGKNFNDFLFDGPIHPTDKANHLLGLAVAQCITTTTPTNTHPAACFDPAAEGPLIW